VASLKDTLKQMAVKKTHCLNVFSEHVIQSEPATMPLEIATTEKKKKQRYSLDQKVSALSLEKTRTDTLTLGTVTMHQNPGSSGRLTVSEKRLGRKSRERKLSLDR
jgi:hypothetical protein